MPQYHFQQFKILSVGTKENEFEIKNLTIVVEPYTMNQSALTHTIKALSARLLIVARKAEIA